MATVKPRLVGKGINLVLNSEHIGRNSQLPLSCGYAVLMKDSTALNKRTYPPSPGSAGFLEYLAKSTRMYIVAGNVEPKLLGLAGNLSALVEHLRLEEDNRKAAQASHRRGF